MNKTKRGNLGSRLPDDFLVVDHNIMVLLEGIKWATLEARKVDPLLVMEENLLLHKGKMRWKRKI